MIAFIKNLFSSKKAVPTQPRYETFDPKTSHVPTNLMLSFRRSIDHIGHGVRFSNTQRSVMYNGVGYLTMSITIPFSVLSFVRNLTELPILVYAIGYTMKDHFYPSVWIITTMDGKELYAEVATKIFNKGEEIGDFVRPFIVNQNL